MVNGAFNQAAAKAGRGGGWLVREDLQADPAGSAINGGKQEGGLVLGRQLWQVGDIDVDKAGGVVSEGLHRRYGGAASDPDRIGRLRSG